jgi:hypothetical protein
MSASGRIFERHSPWISYYGIWLAPRRQVLLDQDKKQAMSSISRPARANSSQLGRHLWVLRPCLAACFKGDAS